MDKIYVDTTDDSLWKYFKDMGNIDLLSQEEEIELAIRIADGDEVAKEKLITSNLKFVVLIAKEYQGNGIPLSDLINDGNIGLIKAAKRFDHTRGFKFISYAVWWIRQSILHGLNEHSRSIRLPVNVINKLALVNKKLSEFEIKFGREPIVGDELNPDGESLIFDGALYPQVSSLDLVINESGDELSSLLPIITDDEYELNENSVKDELDRILNELTPREKDIIQLYYGLKEELEPMTLESIGEKFDLTKERVRQIKEKGIRKLRYHSFDLYTMINE